MGLLSALSTSVAGLTVTSSQLQMVSDNISNASTAGYSAKSANLETIVYGDGASTVRVTGYTRTTDDTTYKALSSATSDSSKYSSTDHYLTQVESILGSNDTSTSNSLSDLYTTFSNAWTSLAAEPESATQRQTVIASGKALASGIQTAANNVETLNRTVKADINSTVSDLNAELKSVAQYNQEISRAKNSGQPTGDLEDERDQVVLKIAQVANVTVLNRTDGSVGIYTAAGYQLVDVNAQQFTYDGTNVTTTSDASVSLNNTLVGGSLEAELNFVDTSTTATSSSDEGTGVIGKLRSMLNSFASSLSETGSTPASFEDAYASGTTGGTFFTATAGSESTTIAVASGLVDGTTTLDTSSVNDVTDALSNSQRTFTSSCLTLSTASYDDWASQIISYFQQAASSISNLSDAATSETSYLTSEYSNNIGVNTDDELVKLTSLESSYNASAKVISVVNDMLTTLMDIV